MKSSPRSILAGIFLLALSVIVFEIGLTRVFAIMMWHHFTYMVISLGLLGFGASGSLLTVRREGLRTGSPSASLARYSLFYGVSVMLAFCFATRVRIDSLAIWQEKANFLSLLLIYLIISVPFLLGGMAIGLALSRLVQHVNKLYFADLLGSAAGAGLSVVLLSRFGSTSTVMFAGCLGLLASFVFGLNAPRRYLVATVPGLLLALVVGISFAGGSEVLRIPAGEWEVPFAPGKEGSLKPSDWKLDRIPSATAEVEVSPSKVGIPTIGGDFQIKGLPLVSMRAAGQDGTAPTVFFENASRIDSFPFLKRTQAASAYVALDARGAKGPEVLVIGVGGGLDVMVALAHDARRITAVEINTAMVEMVTDRYADYMGGLFTPGAHPMADRIELVNGEGRSYLRNAGGRYDVIQMSGVDSYTALSTGAYTLSESYLYTTDAVRDFYAHLKDGGIVNYSRWIMNRPRKPRETLRLANIALEALSELGVEDPASQIAVFQGNQWASTMIKRGPFLPSEIEALSAFAKRSGFVGFVFDPLWKPGELPPVGSSHLNRMRDAIEALVRKGPAAGRGDAEIEALVDGLVDALAARLRGEPLSEDLLAEPLRGPGIEKWALGVLGSELDAAAREAASVRDTQRDFLDLLRGTKEERERFIGEYEFDLTPVTDDMPFFFNYYRYKGLLRGGHGGGDPSLFRYHTDYPVGHLVLVASLLQILALASLMIFLPLRRLAREGLRTRGAWRYFAYFSALGLGFMSIEITLMQKMVIFLGHPTYALSVVLAGLLGFAGIGSFLAGRIQTLQKRHLLLVLLGVLAVIAFDAFAVNRLLPALLGTAFAVRVLAVLALLLPTGILLGMLFPSGMRILKEQCPQLLPWAWAVNAFCSVFASIFCVILSMQIGFTNMLLAAGAVYLVGILAMPVAAARGAEGIPEEEPEAPASQAAEA
ncbi:MAG: hypothetical protein Fur0037_17830 [Planctomycetota bacterium]